MHVMRLGMIIMRRFRMMPVIIVTMIVMCRFFVTVIIMGRFSMGRMRFFAVWFMGRFSMSVIFMGRFFVSRLFVNSFFRMCMRVMPMIIMSGFFMRRFRLCFMDRCRCHRRFQRGRMDGVLREIAFAPVNKTIKREKIIVKPFKQHERQRDQSKARQQYDGRRHTALEIKWQDHTDPCQRGSPRQKHDELHTVGKASEKSQDHKNAEHRTECSEPVLRNGRARIAHIELVRDINRGRCIKHL